MTPLRVLHLASFTGNIGDNANHMGFRPWLEANVARIVEWVDLEIREFYWSERAFDEGFASFANTHDLLVIGGGNYFELWVEDSPTGTSIAIAPEVLAQIKVPIFFNALGVDPGQGVPRGAQERFTTFLDTLLESTQFLVSVRNDGAVDTLETYLGSAHAEAVHHVPDGGFFAPISPRDALDLFDEDRRCLGVNVANDMADVRFSAFPGTDKSARFAEEFAGAIGALAASHDDLDFVFFPHIFRDLDVVHQVLDALPDRLRRSRVTVAPYHTGDRAALATFGSYARCDAVAAMRFHANVCSIAARRPTLGLMCYRQIEQLYRELAQPEGYADVSTPGFSGGLVDDLERLLSDPAAGTARAGAALDRAAGLRTRFEPALADWLDHHSLAAGR